VNSTTKWNFKQLAKDVLVSKASRPASKVVMTYQHLSQIEQYKLYILMKNGKTESQIAKHTNQYKSNNNQELARNTDIRGCRPRQACLLVEERFLGSSNEIQINPKYCDETVTCLHKKSSQEQIADQVGISYETIYRHVYADKSIAGILWEQLHCKNKRKKRYASGRKRRSQIVGRRSISERCQLNDLVSKAINTNLNSITPLVKTLTFGNVKEFSEYAKSNTALQSLAYLADPFASWKGG